MERKNIFFNYISGGFAIVLLSFLVYSNSFNNQFVYDDLLLIKDNPYMVSFSNYFNSLFNQNYYLVSRSTTYRPVAVFTEFLGYSLFGQHTFGYHILAVLLHAFNGILIFILLKKLSGNRNFSLASSLIFVSTPAFSEAIFEYTYNDDTLNAFFYITALLLIIYNNKNYVFLSYPAFILALFSKEMAISLPLVIIIYDLLLNKNFRPSGFKEKLTGIIKTRWFLYSGFILIDISYILIRFFNHQIASPMFRNLSISPDLGQRVLYLPYEIFQFIKISVFPYVLNADRIHYYPDHFFSIENIISIVIFIGIAVYIIKYFSRHSLVVFGILWYLMTLIPVLNVIPIGHPVAERFLYLPSIGFCIILCCFIFYIIPNRIFSDQWPLINLRNIFLVFLISVYSVRTYSRATDWRDSLTLWKKTVELSPESYRAYNNLGIEYFRMGQKDNAFKSFRKAIELKPDDAKNQCNLGIAYYYIDSLGQAEARFRKAIQLDSTYAGAHYYLGWVYKKNGVLKKAIDEWYKVLAIDSRYPNTLNSIIEAKAELKGGQN